MAHGLSCPAACGILVPWPGFKPVSPGLQDQFLTTGPPGKSPWQSFLKVKFVLCYSSALKPPVIFFLTPFYSVKAWNAALTPPTTSLAAPLASPTALATTLLQSIWPYEHKTLANHRTHIRIRALLSVPSGEAFPWLWLSEQYPTPASLLPLPCFFLRALAIWHLFRFVDCLLLEGRDLTCFIYCFIYRAWHTVGAQDIFVKWMKKITRRKRYF